MAQLVSLLEDYLAQIRRPVILGSLEPSWEACASLFSSETSASRSYRRSDECAGVGWSDKAARCALSAFCPPISLRTRRKSPRVWSDLVGQSAPLSTTVSTTVLQFVVFWRSRLEALSSGGLRSCTCLHLKHNSCVHWLLIVWNELWFHFSFHLVAMKNHTWICSLIVVFAG